MLNLSQILGVIARKGVRVPFGPLYRSDQSVDALGVITLVSDVAQGKSGEILVA